VRPNSEVDSWRWFTLNEAREAIKPNSLARAFLLGWLDGEYRFPEYRAE
jgi:NAD+ diphosphatase